MIPKYHQAGKVPAPAQDAMAQEHSAVQYGCGDLSGAARAQDAPGAVNRLWGDA